MKTVLFLGAGFSAAWGLPTMNQFFNYANDSAHLTNEDKVFLNKLQERAYRGANMFQVVRNNLEEILSFCLSEYSLGVGYPDKSNNEYKKLCQILQEVYRRFDIEKCIDGEIKNACQRLLAFKGRYTPQSYELGIITTNYDIMAEFYLKDLGFDFCLPGKWRPTSEAKTNLYKTLESAPSGSLFCKLHGSLNWYTDTKDEDSFIVESGIEDGYYDLDSEEENSVGQRVSLPNVFSNTYKPPDIPVIVPPTLFKMQTEPRFQAIWRSAGELLRNTDKLVFIGFSFPDSDIHIKYFLAANLYDNVRLKGIDIVDPEADKICNELKKSKLGNHFKELLNSIPGKWEENDYSVVSQG
ncbi:MAG: SIR2 family protein [Sedimentisphaerales bacterium]